VDLERAEAAAEIDMGLGADLLVAEDHDVVVEVRLVDALEVFGVDRLRDVEADDFGAHGGVEGAHFEMLGCGFGIWCVGKNGCHAGNVGADALFPNELLVASL
jgi:hypothetical protein